MSSKWVRVGSVRRFDDLRKVAYAYSDFERREIEIFYAWGAWALNQTEEKRERLLDECADVIQATLNLVAALGVEDFRPWMKECERRNRERGRITDGRPGDGE